MCIFFVHRDEQDELIKFFGESPNRFIYEKAPPRGWQEGKRDITEINKIVKVQFTEDGKGDKYQVNMRKNFAKPEFQYPK